MFYVLTFLTLFICPVWATLSGNPAEPALMRDGIWSKGPSWFALKVGYADDWTYRYRFRDEFQLQGVTHTRTFLELSTKTSLITCNIKERMDIYGQLGFSTMQLDEELFSKRAFSWAVGSRLILFQHQGFFCTLDGKYFATNQKPKYFVVDEEAYNIIGTCRLKYEEMQGSLGLAMQAWIFVPYVNLTYILSRIEPVPKTVLVQIPDMDDMTDIDMKSIISKKKWGMALGLSIVDAKKAALSLEWRAFNQNAICVNGSIRF